MNWTWTLRGRDGAMNGLEFARSTTAGDLRRVLVHAAPAQLSLEITADNGDPILSGNADRAGEYSPMTLLDLTAGVTRKEVWPDDSMLGLPVLLAGGEVGLLTSWEHDPERSWWRWSVEFSNHTGRPADWAPPGRRSPS